MPSAASQYVSPQSESAEATDLIAPGRSSRGALAPEGNPVAGRVALCWSAGSTTMLRTCLPLPDKAANLAMFLPVLFLDRPGLTPGSRHCMGMATHKTSSKMYQDQQCSTKWLKVHGMDKVICRPT